MNHVRNKWCGAAPNSPGSAAVVGHGVGRTELGFDGREGHGPEKQHEGKPRTRISESSRITRVPGTASGPKATFHNDCETRTGEVTCHGQDTVVIGTGAVLSTKLRARTAEQLTGAREAWTTARESWDRLENVTVRIKRHENLKSKRNYTSAPPGFYKHTTGSYLRVC